MFEVSLRTLRVVFLDRDGVINKYPGDSEYVKSWPEFQFLPNVKTALKKLKENGFKLFIISNQAGVSNGIYSQESLDIITSNMLAELKRHNIDIEGVYYCTHNSEDNCSCRKPQTGMLNSAVKKLRDKNIEIEMALSYFIGDTLRDIETGKNAGLKTILVFSGKEKPENKNNWQILPDFTAADLSEAADLILKE